MEYWRYIGKRFWSFFHARYLIEFYAEKMAFISFLHNNFQFCLYRLFNIQLSCISRYNTIKRYRRRYQDFVGWPFNVLLPSEIIK